MNAPSTRRITVDLDGESVVLDHPGADLLYDELWDIAFATQDTAALAAAVRMRSLYKLQPIRTIRFAGEEAEAVRQALAQLDACGPPSRDDAA
ncbi:MAG: hypothetical protein ABUS54_04380 [Actinomycetota bacterium]